MINQIVDQDNTGKRLDLFLALIAPGYSRTNLRQMLNEGRVKVQGEVEYRPNYKVRTGELIEIETVAELQRVRPAGWKVDVEIVYQDENIVIANKPAGMNVHPVHTDDNQSLLNAVVYKLGDNLTEFGVNLINRIDKGTSGLVALAVSPAGAWHYAKQFAQGQVAKVYLATVPMRWYHKYREQNVHAANFIRYDARLQQQVVVQTKGEHAETDLEWCKKTNHPDWGLIYAYPRTGRTHQIRVQLAHLKFPILGDVKYGGVEYPRLMLHAYSLKLPKLGGGLINVQTSWPQDLEEIRF